MRLRRQRITRTDETLEQPSDTFQATLERGYVSISERLGKTVLAVGAGLVFGWLGSQAVPEVRADTVRFSNGRVQEDVLTRPVGDNVQVFDPRTGLTTTWAKDRIAGIEEAPVIVPSGATTVPEGGVLVGVRGYGGTFATPTEVPVSLSKGDEYFLGGGRTIGIKGGEVAVTPTTDEFRATFSKGANVSIGGGAPSTVGPNVEVTLNRGDVAETSGESAVKLVVGDANVRVLGDEVTLTFPAGPKSVGLQRGSTAKLPDTGGTVTTKGGKVKITVREDATSEFPAGTEMSVAGLKYTLTARAEQTLRPGDSATVSGDATLNLTGGATMEVVTGDATLTVPGGTTGRITANSNAELPGGAEFVPLTKAAFPEGPAAAAAPPAAPGRTVVMPNDVPGLSIPPQGATIVYPDEYTGKFLAGTEFEVPPAGARMKVPGGSELKLPPGNHTLPEDYTVVDGKTGATLTVTSDTTGPVLVGEDDTVKAPNRDTKADLPGKTRVKPPTEGVPAEGREQTVPAGGSARVSGGTRVDAPKGALVIPNPAPTEAPKAAAPAPAPKAAAPAPAPPAAAPAVAEPTAEQLHKEVDGMLGSGVAKKFHDNVEGARAKLLNGLKANPNLADDARFWLTLGALFGSQGQTRYGQDPRENPNRNEVLTSRRLAMACFNKALELDPQISVRDTSLQGVPFSGWREGVGDTLRWLGVDDATQRNLKIEVKRDGSIALK